MDSRSAQEVLYPVQYLRAAAAIAVFLYHISTTVSSVYGADKVDIDHIGAAGVDLFFVISGFIMAMVVWQRPLTTGSFLRRRAVRVIPLYWAATLALFFLAWIAPSLMGSTTADPLQLLHSLLFLPYGVSAETNAPILLVGWTLNYEVFFYVLVAVFAGRFGDKSLSATLAFIIALVVLGLIVKPQNGYLQFYLDPIILEFALGIGVFHIWRLTGHQRGHPAFALGLAAALIVMLLQLERDPGNLRVVLWGLPAAVLVLCSLHAVRFKSEWLRMLGDWSYSIYILHLFVIMAYIKVVQPHLSFASMPWQIAHLLMAAVLIASSALVFRFFEDPIRKRLT